ncbi:armadillo-type protein [Pelagophyceae sp. CCMP2097]|nr:armadillo-type protein [Pelagophyceae sp. CCMP2097]
MSGLDDPRVMEATLANLNVPDTARVKEAERVLKGAFAHPKCIAALMLQLEHSGNVSVRQVAAVVLRKKITKLWKKLKKAQHAETKAALLRRLEAEQDKSVRKAIAALVSTLAKVLVPGKKWDELLAFISRCAEAPDAGHRELAHLLLLQLSETVASHLHEHLPQLARLFGIALRDSERAVAVMALRASCAFVTTLCTDDEVMLFRDLVPAMVDVARQAVAQRDDAVLVSFFDAFTELAQTPVPVINAHIGTVVPMLLEVMRSPDDALEATTRDGAASVVSSLAEWKPKLLGKSGLVSQIVETCIGIMAHADAAAARGDGGCHGAGTLFVSAPLQRLRQEEKALALQLAVQQGRLPAGATHDPDDDDDDYDGPTPQEIAQTTLDQIVLHVPHKFSLEPTLTLAARCLQDLNSASVRRAGVATIGVVAEGFQDALREHHLARVLQWLAAVAQQDCDAATREVLCFAYGQLAEHCQPEIVAHASAVIPIVFAFLKDARAAVVGTSCYVLEMFCESMDASQLGPVLAPLMERLVALLDHHLHGIREMAVAAIGSAAVAAKRALFEPYLHLVAPKLAQMCVLEAEGDWELRGRALEALGHMALAVGRESFGPYRDHAIAAATRSLQLDSLELAEYAYGFFANVSKVMRGDFGVMLAQLVPHLLDVISRQDGASLDFGDEDGGDERTGISFLDDDDGDDADAGADADDWEDEGGDGSDDDDSDDLGGQAVLNVRTAMMNTKRSALVALGNAAEYTDGAFADHLERSLEVVKVAADYFHHEIRERAAIALQQLAHAACVVHGGALRAPYEPPDVSDADDGAKEPPAILWAAGDGSAALPQPLAAYVDEAVRLLVKILVEDDAKSVVAIACESLNELISDVGPAAVLPQLQPFLEAVISLAKGAATCQTLLGEDGDDDDQNAAVREALGVGGDDDEEDHDNVLMDNVSDLCGGIAKVFGPLLGAAPYDALFEAFARFCAPSKPASDRAMALGCYAELCSELPPALAAERHFAVLHPLFVGACGDQHASVARNAAFGLGALFAAAPDLARPHFPAAFAALYPVIQKAAAAPPERAQADRAAADNAAASMFRLAMADVAAAPLDDILRLVLPLLPLQEDVGENKAVYQCLCGLVRANHAAVANCRPALRHAFAAALEQGSLDDEAVMANVTDVLANTLTA